jgi:carboxypeptidase PM20D1
MVAGWPRGIFMKLATRTAMAALGGVLVASAPAHAASDPALAKAILIRSIGFRTEEGAGQVPRLAAYYASVLKEAGFADADIRITPMGETATLAVTLKGRDPKLKPLLLSGHMDVVAAKRADWTRDPYVPVEEKGYIFGRGAQDNKYDVAMMIATLVRLKKEGFVPRRSIILLLSGDEETAMATTQVLARDYNDAELLLNGDGGGGLLDAQGKAVMFRVQGGEKTYADIEVSFTDPGGHSSRPTATNPVYRMAHALERIEAFRFAPASNELTRATLLAASKTTPGDVGAALAAFAKDPADKAAAELLASRPEYVGQIRTTCVATMVNAGHAPNALPQRAAFTVNCRIFPGVPVDSVKTQLVKVIADPSATVTILGEPPFSDASPMRKDLMAAVGRAVAARYPGTEPRIEIVPSMDAGQSDSVYFRAQGVPSYGIASLFIRSEDSFLHGLNERVPVAGIPGALDQWHGVIVALAK